MCDPTYGGNSLNNNSPSGALPNAPVSGAWFSAQFQQLMTNALPAVVVTAAAVAVAGGAQVPPATVASQALAACSSPGGSTASGMWRSTRLARTVSVTAIAASTDAMHDGHHERRQHPQRRRQPDEHAQEDEARQVDPARTPGTRRRCARPGTASSRRPAPRPGRPACGPSAGRTTRSKPAAVATIPTTMITWVYGAQRATRPGLRLTTVSSSGTGAVHVDLPQQQGGQERDEKRGGPGGGGLGLAVLDGGHQDQVAQREDHELLVPLAEVLARLVVLLQRHPTEPRYRVPEARRPRSPRPAPASTGPRGRARRRAHRRSTPRRRPRTRSRTGPPLPCHGPAEAGHQDDPASNVDGHVDAREDQPARYRTPPVPRRRASRCPPWHRGRRPGSAAAAGS